MSDAIQPEHCPFCHGSGRCARCLGNGNVLREGSVMRRRSQCRACHGSGVCQLCDGSGERPAAADVGSAGALVLPEPTEPAGGDETTFEHWIADWKAKLTLAALRGERPIEQLSREAGVPSAELLEWALRFVKAGERALVDPGLSAGNDRPDKLRDLGARIEELSEELEHLREKLRAELDRSRSSD